MRTVDGVYHSSVDANIPTPYLGWYLVSIPSPVNPRLAVWVSTCANARDRYHVDPAVTQSSACDCDTIHVARVRSCASAN